MHLLDLHLGKPACRGALTVFPIWNGGATGDRRYDLGTGSLAVEERAEGPVVEELVVTNSGSWPVLVLEGELLQGGWQHRVAARTVLVDAGASEVLDVQCVEKDRWAGARRHARTGTRVPPRVRARTREGQNAVWSEVDRYEQRYGRSETASLAQATQAVECEARELVAGLKPLPFQSGVLIGVAGQPLLLEVFDCPDTLRQAWDALLRAAAVDAVGLAPVPTPGRRARRFADRVGKVNLADKRDAGLGSQVRGVSEYVLLDCLLWEGGTVHATALNPRHELVVAQ
ncbi:hypothetical protein FNH05_12305 [Amycolatopsis rhizosphaerae]|uniref:ARG and Rhodanese-Phosphatase-superfamily-associated domain-containing protein n=1 Tax=Amycolatopsis rhizosphaerae TaxID=2053003 RepID=A0A558CW49_9PSEU|nr:DUF6569 family protein [Amycolatopsis rhizosphaerae]TVT52999.1 hypothetical protein FNH05_12305 [Amycolatopsis rhizosphaerae]